MPKTYVFRTYKARRTKICLSFSFKSGIPVLNLGFSKDELPCYSVNQPSLEILQWHHKNVTDLIAWTSDPQVGVMGTQTHKLSLQDSQLKLILLINHLFDLSSLHHIITRQPSTSQQGGDFISKNENNYTFFFFHLKEVQLNLKKVQFNFIHFQCYCYLDLF